jgi:hypothetical protein
VAVNEVDRLVVAITRRREAALGDDAGAARIEHRKSDPVPVRIDADHMVDQFCKHDSGTSL